MIKHFSPISGVAAYAGKWVATAGYDNQVILWDAEKKEALGRVLHDHLANSCTFSSDGKWLATASSDYTARLYRLPDLKLSAVYSGHLDDVEMVVFNHDNSMVATASRDKTIRVFSTSGRLEKEFHGHQADVLSVAFESDGETLISTSDDGTVRRWSLRSGPMETIDLDGVETDTLVITSDRTIIAGNDNGEIILMKGTQRRFYSCHAAGIKRLVLDDRRRRLISMSYDRKCKIWSIGESLQLALIHEFGLPHIVWPRSCAFLSPTQIAFGTFGSSYALYDLDKKAWNTEKIDDTDGRNAVAVHENDIYSIGDSGILFRNNEPISRLGSLCNFLLPVNGRILTGGQSGEVFDGVPSAVIYRHRSPLNCAACFRFGEEFYAVVGTYTGEILLFHVPKDGPVQFMKSVKVHENAIKGITAGVRFLFSVSANREAAKIKIEDLLGDGPSIAWHQKDAHDKIANGCCHLGDDRFASVSRDLKLRIWKDEAPQIFSTPHTHSIKCMAADLSGRFIATGAYNGLIAIFDLGKGSWSKIYRPTTSGISSLYPTRKGFAASSYDGRIYDVSID